MCGINLILNFSAEGEKAIIKMMEAIRHRGPDHSEWLAVNEELYLAANRLKTIDLGDWANQPVNVKDSYFLCWNGALYNAEDLRNRLLQLGEAFQSRSDSEIIIKWLSKYGADGIVDFQGMYSILFIDKVSKILVAARDQFGKKPLYYFHQSNKWIFSSEAKAIAQSGIVPSEIDSAQYLPYFYSRHSLPVDSFYRDVKQLLPGEIMSIDFEGNLLEHKKLSFQGISVRLPDKQHFKMLLTDAVLNHFQADVPVGILLSGGADSSLLLSTWFEETGIPLHTFTVTFEDAYLKKYQDPKYAKWVSQKYNCEHHEILITQELVLENWGAYIDSLDQPIGDSAGFISWMIAKEAKKYVKILVSGAGADELFGGYGRHEAFKFYLKFKELLTKSSTVGGSIPFLTRRLKKMLLAVEGSEEATFLNFSSLRNVPKQNRSHFLDYYPTIKTPFKAALEWDRNYYLVNDVLKIHDNALMAHGIEGRAPYLDKAIVELSLSLSEEQHLQLKSKQWIRESLEDVGLGKIANRKKIGFGLPLKEWLLKDQKFRDYFMEHIKPFVEEQRDYLPQEIHKLSLASEKFIKDNFLQIWNLFVLASWYQKNKSCD
ncbi:asparagine synthase (glutamine-hydrolyzing) [Echinicola sp. CAU 1574]|uniref:asparagine synthase (glutamine-hydrolyzing) n=1 Tax=Echinicola arenosa TaxID=2774144 RepID=A0ABR9AK00_9BACT|nr:asparagine synthase (glutamine-hydrolyzing) [Echinicola arenosa]MBD8488672.1 asparagine synthase (glutamine-hydrolyzing) [Echinicola arenosa]